MAFDKKSGQTMWVSSPGGRPFDTTYSPPVVADINGTRLLIAGGGDGTMHALKAQTGEPVWKYVISKRGMNTGAVLKGTTAIISHSEENLNTSEMGLLAAIDATATGEIGQGQIKWSKTGFQGGFSSPVIDGDRFYQIDNGANLFAFDIATGKQIWTLNLGNDPESLSRACRRQALRRDGERKVLHTQARRGPVRSARRRPARPRRALPSKSSRRRRYTKAASFWSLTRRSIA